MDNNCEISLNCKEVDDVNPTDFSMNVNICAPIKNIWELSTCIQNPPGWINNIIDIYPRSPFVVKNEMLDCHTESDSFTPTLRLDRNCVPRTLVCHDMKNGYLEDRFLNSVNVGNCYTFYQWSQIDIFVYFSHHFITIPPLSWINLAHKNGVKIFGTLITEWNKGSEICKQIFRDEETMKEFASKLVDVSKLFKLDGWLLNFENNLEAKDAFMLLEFVKYFSQQMHVSKPGSLVIWYDSIIKDGKLSWQNELNELNQCYFDVCDGIFLNYTWKEEHVVNSLKFSKHRALDVYVGVDVFGRNFYGGGKFNTHVAVDLIRKHGLSVAIFAPGWTHERITPLPADTLFERFIDRENAFWKTLWPFLFTHPITRPFTTIFYTGVEKNWYKLQEQNIQLTKCLNPANENSDYSNISTLNDACNCIKVYVHDNYTSCFITKQNMEKNRKYVHNLFTCDFFINGKAIVYNYTKSITPALNGSLNIIILVQDVNGASRKITCNSDEKNPKKNNLTNEEINPTNDVKITSLINDAVQPPDDWVLRCYIVNFNGSNVIEIGAEIDQRDTVCLCGFGIKYDDIIENL